jgi:hypothetical protein
MVGLAGIWFFGVGGVGIFGLWLWEGDDPNATQTQQGNIVSGGWFVIQLILVMAALVVWLWPRFGDRMILATMNLGEPGPRRMGWPLWWRWVVWSVGGRFAVALAAVIIAIALGGRPGMPFPTFALVLGALADPIVSGAFQSRLLRGHVRAAGRWLAIAGAFGLLAALLTSVSPTDPTPFQHSLVDYLSLGGIAAALAVAQWWLVLRPSVPRSVAWVPIVVAAAWTALAVADVLAAVGLLGIADIGLAMIGPVITASGMVYLLRASQ